MTESSGDDLPRLVRAIGTLYTTGLDRVQDGTVGVVLEDWGASLLVQFPQGLVRCSKQRVEEVDHA